MIGLFCAVLASRETCLVSSFVLPCRNRCLIFISRDECHPAERLASEFESLQIAIKSMTRHALQLVGYCLTVANFGRTALRYRTISEGLLQSRV